MQQPKKALTRKKRGTRHAKAASLTLLIFGIASSISSAFYNSQILAFIGISLTFWGALLLYIQPEEHVKKTVLEAATQAPLATLNKMMEEIDYEGEAIYLPPKYLKDPEASKIYIPKHKNQELPPPKLILKHEHQLFLDNPRGILLNPPGAQMTTLFEKTLGTSFTRTDLQTLQQNLPKILIEDLEIAEDLEIQIENAQALEEPKNPFTAIHIKITNSICQDLHKQEKNLSYILSKIGCPLCSAIACALAKATGKPITIEKTQTSPDGKTLEVHYRILETTEPAEETYKYITPTLKPTSKLRKMSSLAFIATGTTILAWIAWLTWYDTTTWGKDLFLIFLGSRTGEAIDMGIGMKVIYYLLIGLASLTTGITLFPRKSKKLKAL